MNASAVLAATLLGSLCVSIAAGPQGQASAISVLGCLDRQQPHDFFLSDEEGNLYTLTGVTSDLIKHVGEEIRIEGTRDESTKPLPSLHVIGFQQVFTAPSPSLSSSFTNTAAWRTDRNQAYGLKFSHPESFPNSKAAVSANFPDDDGTATLGSFEMPSEIYAGTNFVGGSFTLSVSPKITNRASCKQFGTFDPKYLSSATENGIEYAVSTELSAPPALPTPTTISTHSRTAFVTKPRSISASLTLAIGILAAGWHLCPMETNGTLSVL